MDPGMIGGIIGGLIGVTGAVLGTYCAIKGTKGPRERAAMVKASVVFWIGMILFAGLFFAVPVPLRALLIIPYAILLFLFITLGNRSQQRIRAEESQNESDSADG